MQRASSDIPHELRILTRSPAVNEFYAAGFALDVIDTIWLERGLVAGTQACAMDALVRGEMLEEELCDVEFVRSLVGPHRRHLHIVSVHWQERGLPAALSRLLIACTIALRR